MPKSRAKQIVHSVRRYVRRVRDGIGIEPTPTRNKSNRTAIASKLKSMRKVGFRRRHISNEIRYGAGLKGSKRFVM